MTLPVAEFLRRYLQHVPPQGFHMVRAYGLYRRGLRAGQLSQRAREIAPLDAELCLSLKSAAVSFVPGVTRCGTCQMPVSLITKLAPRPLGARAAPPGVAA